MGSLNKHRGVFFLLFIGVLALIPLLVACAGAAGPQGSTGLQGATGPEGAAGAAAVLTGDGLQMETLGVAIGADRKPVVTFTVKDAQGNPLKLTDLDGNPRFTIARIETDAATGLTQYVNYITTTVQGKQYTYNGVITDPVLATATQPGADSGGTFAEVEAGKYTYTFNTALPEGYSQNATHVVGGQATRSSRYYVANPLYTFVPSGAAVSVTREVVALQNCNKCHGTLALHGGTRRDTKYCALCHTAQNTDPETGRVLEFKQMVHQIHQGEDLPSVESGTPFYIVGYRQTVADFSEVGFPQDVRNCTTCHSGAAQADNWKTAPSRAACGACHDDVDFATGTNHAGGAQTSDAACTACHGADTGLAPISVKHQVPSLGFEYTVELSLSAPANGQYYVAGETPVVTLVIKDANTGVAIDPSTIVEPADPANIQSNEWSRANLFVSGPRSSTVPVLTTAAAAANPAGFYAGNDLRVRTDPATEDARVTRSATAITYQLADVAGLDSGTYTVLAEFRRTSVFPPVPPLGGWALLNFQVSTATEEPMVATNCTACHNDARMHEDFFAVQFNPDICKSCHDYVPQIPGMTSWSQLNWGFGAAPLARRVHGVHFGASLDKPGEVSPLVPVDYSDVVFPQDVRNCTKCHSQTSAWTEKPSRLACLACHDSDAAIAHGSLMTVDATPDNALSGDEVETCKVCHGANREFTPSAVHKPPIVP